LRGEPNKHLAYLWECNREALEMCRAGKPDGSSIALQTRLLDQGIKIAAMIAKNQLGGQHGKKAAGFPEPDDSWNKPPWPPPPGTVLPQGAETMAALSPSERMFVCDALNQVRSLLRLTEAVVEKEGAAAGRVPFEPDDVRREAYERVRTQLDISRKGGNDKTKPPTALLSEDR
jgi:hypothetical protein